MDKKIIKIGIIGGLGPLASCSFVETIYTHYLNTEKLKELYYAPYVYLNSEPLISQNRGMMSVKQSEGELLAKLEKNIINLLEQEVDHIVICCFTAHKLLPRLLPVYQTKIFSLLALIIEHVLQQKTPVVMLTASSALEAKVIESHPSWPKIEKQIIFLKEDAQRELNLLINGVKNNQVTDKMLERFLDLMNKFHKQQLIIACSELHILHKKLLAQGSVHKEPIFDPFFDSIKAILRETI